MKHTDKNGNEYEHVLLQHVDWPSYPMFNTIEEAHKQKEILEDEHPFVYMTEPINVVVFYNK